MTVRLFHPKDSFTILQCKAKLMTASAQKKDQNAQMVKNKQTNKQNPKATRFKGQHKKCANFRRKCLPPIRKQTFIIHNNNKKVEEIVFLYHNHLCVVWTKA